jgi:hypothetical protein
MARDNADTSRAARGPQTMLRVVESSADVEPGATSHAEHGTSVEPLSLSLRAAEERAHALTARLELVRSELRIARAELVEAESTLVALPHAGLVLRYGVCAMLVVLLGLSLWARHVDYALRVTSDTPTFLALLSGMARSPFEPQSLFLEAGAATQHATPYMQALALLWRLVGGSTAPVEMGSFLALAGICVFAFTLWCVFLYVGRLAGSTAAWVSLPVLLGLFGPPHVIWASDLSLHAALYAGFFPQNLAIALALLTLLVLDGRSTRTLIAASLLASAAMLVHPFTGVLLAVLATAESCRLGARRDRAARRAPIALVTGFLLGQLWPAYSLDSAFAETGLRGFAFVGLCVAVSAVAFVVGPTVEWSRIGRSVGQAVALLETPRAAFRLAVVGATGTLVLAAWEVAMVRTPPDESARLAIYWVDERWRWPLLFVTGAVGLTGLARLARRGHVVPAVWFTGCFALGALGAIGLPLPVWYRFLLLCQVPLAVGVAVVVAQAGRTKLTAIVAATFAVALCVKLGTLLEAPDRVSYFGRSLQPVWSLGQEIPPGPGLVATDPATAYFIPATTGHRVLTVDKGHVSNQRELEQSKEGYRLLRRYYGGGPRWWAAAQEMWHRGVRYIVVAKQTTLEPRTLDDFIWQNARLVTAKQRKALGNYFYENNRIGTLLFDSPDFAVYRIDPKKVFRQAGS